MIVSDPQLISKGSVVEDAVREARRNKEDEHRDLAAALVGRRGRAAFSQIAPVETATPYQVLFEGVRRLRSLLAESK
jgi:hypothetical protein